MNLCCCYCFIDLLLDEQKNTELRTVYDKKSNYTNWHHYFALKSVHPHAVLICNRHSFVCFSLKFHLQHEKEYI